MRLHRYLTIAGLLVAMTPIVTMGAPLISPDQSTPDSAATSPITAAFIAAVGPFNGFLEASDRLAASRARRGLRGFATREFATRQRAMSALRAWAAGIARARYSEAHAPTIDRLGPVFGLLDSPIDIVAVPADLQQRRDLEDLQRLDGAAFNAVYMRAQVATLLQLENTYVDYIKNGDDQVLRAFSVRDLGAVRSLLTRLRKT